MSFSKMEWHPFIAFAVMISFTFIEADTQNACQNYRDFTIIRGTECNSYVFCYMGYPFRQGWCFLGTGFDPVQKRCTWHAFLTCEKEELKKKATQRAIFVCPGSLKDALYPDYTLGCPTNKYLRCQNGVLTNITCPPSTFYNDGIDACDSYMHIPCAVTNTLCPQELKHGIFADYSTGCPPSKYFVCLGYNRENTQKMATYKYEYTCPDGLYFNEGIKSCDYIQNVPCQHNIKH